MATHTQVTGDMKLPVGTYETTENGQPKTKRRFRDIGAVMETEFGDGSKGLSVRLHVEMLSMEAQVMLRANGILTKGEDSVLCPIYKRERKAAVPAAGAGPTEQYAGEDVVPF